MSFEQYVGVGMIALSFFSLLYASVEEKLVWGLLWFITSMAYMYLAIALISGGIKW